MLTSTGAATERRVSALGRLGIISQPWVWVAALTALAFFLRRFHLGEQSFWFDEADIVQRAQQPVSVLLRNFAQAGENGPLYTLLLHYWLAAIGAFPLLTKGLHVLFGANYEAVVRGLSAVSGTAAIPVMYLLAKRLGGKTLGFVAAILLAFNPFHIWYSQDAKMYALLVLATLVSTVLYVYALDRNTVPLWAGYVLSTWAMLTVHSMAGLVLLAQIAATPFLHMGSREESPGISPKPGARGETLGLEPWTLDFSGRWLRWGLAMVLICAPLLPILWLRIAAVVTGTLDVGGWYSPTGLADILLTIFVKFAVNQAPAPWETIGAIAVSVLAFVGLLARIRGWSDGTSLRSRITGSTGPWFIVLVLWLLPIVAFWLVTLAVPLFQPRYLIMALPPYLIMLGAGLLALKRIQVALLGAALLALGLPTIVALSSTNYSTDAQKEDWRGAMIYVQDHLRLRDAIVVFPGYLRTAVDVYYKPGGPGRVPQVPVETINSLQTQNFGERELEAELRSTIQCHERVWVVISPVREEQEDPTHKVLQWYQFNFHTFDTKVFNGVTVYGISFNGIPNCGWFPAPTHDEKYMFQNGLQFWGYIYELRDNATTQPDASYFPLTIYWHSTQKMDTDYIVRIQIKDKAGHAVVDEALGTFNGYWPTSQWPSGTYAIDYRDLRLPGGMTPGDYTVTVQLYPKGHPDQPLKLVDGGTEIILKAPLPVVPWKP